FTMPLFGILGDRIGFKWVFLVGSVGIMSFAPSFFSMLQTLDPTLVTVAVVIAIGVVYAALYGPEGSLFSAQFPAEVRYSGISIAVQVSGAIGGGLAPIVATSLLAYGDGNPRYIVWYLSALGAIAILSTLLMHGPARFATPVASQLGRKLN
ncbi:MAG: MFS transporter, partial [Alcaligenaceae bacterium]